MIISQLHISKNASPFQRELVSQEGEQGLSKCLCCCAPVPSRLSILLASQAQMCLHAVPSYHGLLGSPDPQCWAEFWTGRSRRWELWGGRAPTLCTGAASSADSTQVLFKTRHFCIQVLLKGRPGRKRKLTEHVWRQGERGGKVPLLKRDLFTFPQALVLPIIWTILCITLSYLLEKLCK